jgi:hypothetical protein
MKRGEMGSLVTVSMLMGLLVLPMLAFTASATVTQLLQPDYEVRNDAYLLSSVAGANAASALTMVKPGYNWFDTDYGYDTNYWDGAPGCIYWGNGTSSTSGTYGTAYVKIGLTDIVTEDTGYWSVDAFVVYYALGGLAPWTTGPDEVVRRTAPGSIAMSVSVGFGCLGDSPAETMNATSIGNITTTVTTPLETAGYALGVYNIMNGDYSRPWSTEEVNDGYLILKLEFDASAWGTMIYTTTPISLVVAYVQVQVQSEAYTPPTPATIPTGSFILRPDGVSLNATWGAFPATCTDMADSTNETNYFSDGENSYAYATFSGLLIDVEELKLTFSDPMAGYTFATRFTVIPWVIMRSTTASVSAATASATIFDSTDPGTTSLVYFTTTSLSYTNYTTTTSFLNPRTNTTWTLTDLEDLSMGFGVIGALATGQLRISQVGVLVIPYWTDDNAWDFSGMLQYLGGGMIPTLIGVMGFAMLIGVPTIAVWSYKNGESDGMSTVLHAVVLMVLGFGFFMVGLIGA